MKKMKVNILKSFSIFPLVFLMAVAPVLCCCFQDTASAAVETVSSQSNHSSHCSKNADQSSEDHKTKDCDCPSLLSEGSLSGLTKIGAPSNLFQKSFDFSLMENGERFYVTYLSSSLIDKDYLFHHQQKSPPLFILNRTLRI